MSPTQGLIRTIGCEAAVHIDFETAGEARTCTAEWSDGTTITKRTVPAIKIDKTAPTDVAGAPARGPDSNGWYRAPVDVRFAGTDAMSGIASCTSTMYRAPDGANRSVPGSCRNNAGLVAAAVYSLKYDASPPTVTSAVPGRAPDSGTWYRRPISFTFTGEDPVSGLASCSPATYSGPDRAGARVTGRCVDMAGNAGTAAFALRYDGTAPSVRAIFGRRPDRYGWYSHDVRIRFAGTDGVSGVASCSPVRLYGRPNDPSASVRGACVDGAGNRRTRTFGFKYSEPLLFPRAGTRVAAPPLLDWVSVQNARFYNIQIWRDGQRLSRWPAASKLQLGRSWTFNGRRYTLTPGRYTWYVWPRFAGRYGRMIGKSFFVVR